MCRATHKAMRFWLLLVVMSAGCTADLSKYERIPGREKYLFSRELKSWFDAKRACEEDGARLAVIKSYDDAKALRRVLLNDSNIMAHVGFNDLEEEGEYKIVTGGTLSSSGYNKWKHPPTGNAVNEANDCGAMFNCGRLTDVLCEELHPFFCELP